jgi:hypothetical protein
MHVNREEGRLNCFMVARFPKPAKGFAITLLSLSVYYLIMFVTTLMKLHYPVSVFVPFQILL